MCSWFILYCIIATAVEIEEDGMGTLYDTLKSVLTGSNSGNI